MLDSQFRFCAMCKTYNVTPQINMFDALSLCAIVVYAIDRCLCLVTNKYHIPIAKQIELVFGTEATHGLSNILLKGYSDFGCQK